MPWSSLWNCKVKIYSSVNAEFQKHQILQEHEGCRITWDQHSLKNLLTQVNNHVFVWLPAWTPALTSSELLQIFLESIFRSYLKQSTQTQTFDMHFPSSGWENWLCVSALENSRIKTFSKYTAESVGKTSLAQLGNKYRTSDQRKITFYVADRQHLFK